MRPLAQLQHQHQSFLVVSADADAARVHVVAATEPSEVKRIRGDVKNHVKKGGWSQKRYQRRRANEMLLYAKEVADVVTRVVDEEGVTRIVLLGAQEATDEIASALPDRLQAYIVGRRAWNSAPTLAFAKPQRCPACTSNSVFAVDLVNELVELLALSSATAEFVEPLAGLSDEGNVAALLRY